MLWLQGVSAEEMLLQRDQALSAVEKLKVRIADLFGPEAAQLDAVKAQAFQGRKGR